jgi:PAS domain S-box-containing protein
MNQVPPFLSDLPAPLPTETELEVEALRESQRMLSSLLQNLPGIAFRMAIDEHWTVSFISAGCFRLTGYTPEDIVGNRRISYEQLTHPDDRARVRERIMTALAGRRPYDVVYRLVTAEGRDCWVWERGQGIAGDDGRLEFLEGFLTDVTERRHAEEQVKAQAALLDKARDAILVTDLGGRVHYCNQSAHELFGWTIDGCCQISAARIFQLQPDGFARALSAVLARGEWSGELPAVGCNARSLVLESRWTLVRDDHGEPRSILLISTDVTERKKLEAQILRAQRMESIGTLAGGIAHDLNNVLSPILTAMEMIRERLPERQDQELVHIVEASANRGAEMVRQILVFARGAEGRRNQVAPHRILEDLVHIIRETFPRNLHIHSHLARDLWPILGDATQLHQVLLNLCVNARDAMPDGGTLTLRASNLVVDGPGAFPDAPAGPHVLLEVSDTGAGIPEEIQERIFDPFFTTKEVGKGTGLGLSTVQVIVRNHGGVISLRSKLGRGTTFRILLPATGLDGTENLAGTAVELPMGQGEMVLVVDDETGIRMVTQRALENCGYRVVVAKNGSDGLAVFARHQAEIAAVISDLMMPVMDGPTMIEELRRRAPKLPIIAVTGLVAPDLLARIREAGVQTLVPKPFTSETLRRALAAALLAPANAPS